MKGKKLLAGVLSAAMVLGTMALPAFADDAVTTGTTGSVTVSGVQIAAGKTYGTIQEAYDEIKAELVAKAGLQEEALNEEDFNAFFTDGGKITWTISGEQNVTDPRMFSFGRKANRFGDGRLITEINIVGGENAVLDLSDVNGTFALPYNWWGTGENTALKCKNITFNGIKSMPSGTYQNGAIATVYEFDGCTFNGNLYSYQNFDVDMTIKNSTFNAPDNETTYAFMSQGAGGTITLDNNKINGYTRGINLQRETADFIVTNNTIKSSVSKPDRGAVQITDGKSFVVTGNTIDVNGGNAFWFHDAAKNSDVTYTISDNNIKAPYLANDDTTFGVNDKITAVGNIYNDTDTKKCMEKDATEATESTVTALQSVAKIGDKEYATLKDAVAAAQDGDTITILGKVAVNPGDLPAQPNNKKLTFKGDGDDELTFVDSTGYNMYYANGSSLTFDTLTITWKDGDQPYQGIAHTADTVYNNCTINGELCLYASNSETFKNCTFVQPSADAYNVRTWGAKKAAFENCKFRSNGKSLLVYNESCVDRTKPNNTDDDKYKSITEPNKVVVNKCEFYADNAASGKAAIEVDSWFGPVALEISDSSAVGFDEGSKSGHTLYNIKKVNPRIATADDSTKVIVNNQAVDLEQIKNGASNPSDAKPVIKIALVKNDAASTEDSHVYDIKVVSDSDINKLNSTDITFSFVTDKANEYAITAAENVVLTNDGNSHRYMFSFKNGEVRKTAKEITIGKATVTGYGKYTLKVDDSAGTNVVNATTLAASLVDSYVTDGSADGKLDIADSTTDENGQKQEITIPTRKLSVKIYMNNSVTDQKKAYQAMKVDIAGGDYSETIALGSDAAAQENKVYTVEKELPINTAYTVTVSGAGYRTARYTVNLTNDKTLNFWNNVADNEIEVELGNDAYKKDVTFLAGDIVKDGTINIYDLSAVVSYFGTINNVDTESEYAKYDLNRDGKIDSKDVAYVLVSWKK